MEASTKTLEQYLARFPVAKGNLFLTQLHYLRC